MSSWVSFWLVKTDKGQEIPARTALGATCSLAVVTIGRYREIPARTALGATCTLAVVTIGRYRDTC